MPKSAKNMTNITKLIECARQAPDQIAFLRLSKTQLKVLLSIKNNEQVTAKSISNRFDISTSFASSLLKQLFERGYMTRERTGHVTGGLEFVYVKI